MKMNNEYDLIFHLHNELIDYMYDKMHYEKELIKKESEIERLNNIVDEQYNKIQELLEDLRKDDSNE